MFSVVAGAAARGAAAAPTVVQVNPTPAVRGGGVGTVIFPTIIVAGTNGCWFATGAAATDQVINFLKTISAVVVGCSR